MNCPTCGSENPNEAAYCANCGVPLSGSGGRAEAGEPVVYCTSCGAENAQWAMSCASCGEPLQALPAERGGTSPASNRDDHPYYPPSGYTPTTGIFIPRNLDGLLGETFRVYRENFLKFYLIALVAQIPSLIAQLDPVPQKVSIFLMVLGYLVLALAAGATVCAVASQYLGRPTTIIQCYARAWNRVLSLLASGIFFILPSAILTGSIIGIFLFLHRLMGFDSQISQLLSILIGLVIGIHPLLYILVRWFFYTEAIIIEGRRGPTKALGRSYGLVQGSWWRVFGIGVVFVVLLALISLIASVPGSIVAGFSPIGGAILLSVFSSAVTPIFFIGRALVYLDLRIRNEGYTLGTMASEVDA